jgi:[ribosomal protein S5]-alanine N-acetyltransferase
LRGNLQSLDRITTSRLDLVASTVALLEAELESNQKLSAMLDVNVPDGWPPGEYDPPAIKFFRDRLTENPSAAGWFGWYAILRARDNAPGILVGSGGFMGPPDTAGVVEIGYSVVKSYEGRGYATEIARALVDLASSDVRVKLIIAHANPQNVGSVRVLERAGFSAPGPANEHGMVRFERLCKTM